MGQGELKRDIYTYDYRNVEMIVCYLFPDAMQRSIKIFDDNENIKCLISNTFALPLRKATEKIDAHDLYRSPIYIYINE